MARSLKDGTCPHCDSASIFTRTWDGSALIGQVGVVLMHYLCGKCGSLETYIKDVDRVITGEWHPYHSAGEEAAERSPSVTNLLVQVEPEKAPLPPKQAIDAPLISELDMDKRDTSLLPELSLDPQQDSSKRNKTLSKPPEFPDTPLPADSLHRLAENISINDDNASSSQNQGIARPNTASKPQKKSLSPDEQRIQDLLMPFESTESIDFMADVIASSEQSARPETSTEKEFSDSELRIYDMLFGAPPPPGELDPSATQEAPEFKAPPADQALKDNGARENSYLRFLRDRHHDNKTLFEPKSGQSQRKIQH